MEEVVRAFRRMGHVSLAGRTFGQILFRLNVFSYLTFRAIVSLLTALFSHCGWARA